MKIPDWKNAPEWAKYLTGDADGWYWWENKPALTWQGTSGKFCEVPDSARADSPAPSIEERP